MAAGSIRFRRTYVDYDGLGMRIPMLIISPYAKKGYVSHVHYEHGSILRFVEDQFGLKRLAASDTARHLAGERRLRLHQAAAQVQGFRRCTARITSCISPTTTTPPTTSSSTNNSKE